MEKKRIPPIVYILPAVLLACGGITAYLFLHVGSAYRASSYGVEEPGMSALVLYNHTSDFYIYSITLTDESGSVQELGSIWIGETGIFPVKPGSYLMTVEYSDRSNLEDIPNFTWYVHAYTNADLILSRGRAALLEFAGGNSTGMLYYEPELRPYEPEE